MTEPLRELLREAFRAGEAYLAHDEGLRGAEEPVPDMEAWIEQHAAEIAEINAREGRTC